MVPGLCRPVMAGLSLENSKSEDYGVGNLEPRSSLRKT